MGGEGVADPPIRRCHTKDAGTPRGSGQLAATAASSRGQASLEDNEHQGATLERPLNWIDPEG